MDVAVAQRRDEEFLLDLLNTTPVVDGQERDVLADPDEGRAWLRAHEVDETERANLTAVRDLLQDVVRGARSPALLDRFLGDVTMRPTVTPHGVGWELSATPAARAVLAWDALRINSPGRLRACANDECRLFLIDRSKPNTARWCSMAICGNRMKARRYYRRAKGADGE
ncbi:CGNR zinc finger domain-containing protein [Mycolicibacterium goodii]|uniref:CGNR zinc finger domain-containing protein n=1 Tax=Mycolicibacterium goodii TaxID=134601 RepID=UPI001F035509|nr:CGNR zinc finger domain-containing protein [Mycolicibacterium goodii]ULN47940.1 CGNR zinc finger domain-containing protein [Mycolicibacterium goodii]